MCYTPPACQIRNKTFSRTVSRLKGQVYHRSARDGASARGAEENRSLNSISTVEHKEGLASHHQASQAMCTNIGKQSRTTVPLVPDQETQSHVPSATRAKLDKPFRSPKGPASLSVLQRFQSAPPRGTLERRGPDEACACPLCYSINSFGQGRRTIETGDQSPVQGEQGLLYYAQRLTKMTCRLAGRKVSPSSRTRTNA